MNHYVLRKYNNEDYDFVYEVKKNAYKICRAMLGKMERKRAKK